MTVDYSMRISRLTVDKLGVKLYDRVSAVIAELIANAYDADASKVSVSAPMGQFLATKVQGAIKDKGFDIHVVDDGIGMTPQQVQDFFLVVGAERRKDPNRGEESRQFRRKVMGRKGVGKLAPFGICKTIEVISAGGEPLRSDKMSSEENGYLTSHIILDYDSIVAIDDEPDAPYKPGVGIRDQTLSPVSGTSITLRGFNYRKVPEIDVLSRQISQRFGIKSADWAVSLIDNSRSGSEPTKVGDFEIDTMPNTRFTFADDQVLGPDGCLDSRLSAGFQHEGDFYPISGWMAYSKSPYRDELMAGIRIYCRGKIAAQTTIFGHRAGFTGEHNIRSYLVGELNADWLDADEDLIQTDRRDILWSDELASAFQEWGQGIVKRIGTRSRDPLRKATLEVFLETGDVDAKILRAYPAEYQEDIRRRAQEFARSFGRTMNGEEAKDVVVVEELVDLSITLAPHVTLNDMMREATAIDHGPLTLLSSFLRTARLAELSSFGRIAEDRLKVVERLEELKNDHAADEQDLQQLIADAPWLINPEWAPITENQTLSRLRKEFERFYEDQTGESISLAEFKKPNRRPDFVLSSQEGVVQIIEIKKPHHKLTNDEMDRVVIYYQCMDAFLSDPAHRAFKTEFRDFHITLVCDSLGLSGAQQAAFQGYVASGKLTHMDWGVFLLKTERVHRSFLKEALRQRESIPSRVSDR